MPPERRSRGGVVDRGEVESKQPSALSVHDRLRARILQGAFDPEVPISQVQLARELGVSRTPLREALRMLQEEGLIESQANRMVRSARLSISDLEQVYALRVVLESFGVRVSVPKLTDDDIEEIERCLDRVELALGQGDLDAWEVAHLEFHRLTRRHAGERLQAVAGTLADHSGLYRRFYLGESGSRAAALQEHRDILAALAARDASAAGDSVARHLARTALTTAAAVSPEYDPAVVREALRYAIGSSAELTTRSRKESASS